VLAMAAQWAELGHSHYQVNFRILGRPSPWYVVPMSGEMKYLAIMGPLAHLAGNFLLAIIKCLVKEW